MSNSSWVDVSSAFIKSAKEFLSKTWMNVIKKFFEIYNEIKVLLKSRSRSHRHC